jgi:hypothetical protein
MTWFMVTQDMDFCQQGIENSCHIMINASVVTAMLESIETAVRLKMNN